MVEVVKFLLDNELNHQLVANNGKTALGCGKLMPKITFYF